MSAKKPSACTECGKPAVYTRFHCSPECKERSPWGPPGGELRSIKGGKKKGAPAEADPMAAMFQHVISVITPVLERIDASNQERENRSAIRQYLCTFIRAGYNVEESYKLAEEAYLAEIQGIEAARAERAKASP